MQIAHRVEIAGRGLDRIGHRCRIELSADERRHIQPQRPIADAADAERDVEAAPSSPSATWAAAATNAKSERRRADLEEADPDAPVRQTGKPDALTHSPWPMVVSIGPMKNHPPASMSGHGGREQISAPSVTATSGISPMDRRLRSSRRPCRGCGSADARPTAAPAPASAPMPDDRITFG